MKSILIAVMILLTAPMSKTIYDFKMKDIDGKEMLYLSALAILVIGFGLYPQPIMEMSQTSVEHLISQLGSKMVYLFQMV